LLECRLVVREDDILGATNAMSEEFGGVAAALDLKGKAAVCQIWYRTML